jgi:hypothetical protein
LIVTANIDILDPTKVPTMTKETEAKPIGQPIVGNGMYTINNGANRISDCPLANETMRAGLQVSNSVFTLDESLNILGGLERDFNCASMCKRSPLYSFSEVSRGPPPESCRRAITKKVSRIANCFFWSSLVFSILTALGFIVALIITFSKRGELDEPLLQPPVT